MFKKTSTTSGYRDPEVLVGLDLGTSKITVVVAERDGPAGEAQIIGMGQAPSHGIRKGMIVHLDQAARAVRQAVGDAENMVGLELSEVTVSFSGGEVRSVRSKGMISLGRSPRAVKQLDIARVIEAAQADVSVPANQMILHTIPVEYSLDGNSGIDDPLGMNGMRLDIDLESVIVPSATVQNVYNCVENAGLSVTGFVIKPLASALGALTPEESVAGAVSVDIGGGTCGVAVFADGRPKHLAVVPVGGDHITNDVASVLKIPINKAEEIKKEVDLFSPETLEHTEKLEFDHNGRNYSYSLSELTEIVQCRVEELFTVLVKKEVGASGVSMLPAGLVITGGGSRSIGIDQYLSRVMDMPVRAALPIDSNRMPPGRNGPEYTCASGIIKYALEQERDPFRYMEQSLDLLKGQSRGSAAQSGSRDYDAGSQEPARREGSIFQSIKDVFKELF
ncbi:cell division protein FtsA [Synergistaceae bacterium OttesenSCG-928-I11]|nr:cell division protein FtsA [Synergistaceae bacterium OttesenSCG-928-I11]